MSDFPDIRIEADGDGYALARYLGEVQVDRFHLEPAELLLLPRSIHPVIRQMLETALAPALKTAGFSNVPALAAEAAIARPDAHLTEVLVYLRDVTDTRFGFSLTPKLARDMAAQLTESASQVETAKTAKPS